jgi:hypothetical protein
LQLGRVRHLADERSGHPGRYLRPARPIRIGNLDRPEFERAGGDALEPDSVRDG